MTEIIKNAPIDHPSVWRGEELLHRDDWLWRLSETEVQELDAAVGKTEEQGLSLEEIDKESFPLPTLGPRLASIQDSLENGSGAAMLKGFPLDRYDQEQTRRIFWGIARHIGTPVSQSAAGEKIFSVRDEGYREGDPKARGPNTKKRLSFHTDRCDVISFLCLKQAKSGGENALVSSPSLYNELLVQHPELLRVLMQPFYYQRHNVDQGNELPYCQQPIFSIYQGHFAANFLRVLIERAYQSPELPHMTSKQRDALDSLEALADESEQHIVFRQQPGDMLFLNNWVTLHRRSEFEDDDDLEQRRHILRIWLAVPNSRPLHPLFADNYGATEAGVIRGGMKKREASSSQDS